MRRPTRLTPLTRASTRLKPSSTISFAISVIVVLIAKAVLRLFPL